jgi:hypothetical protein
MTRSPRSVGPYTLSALVVWATFFGSSVYDSSMGRFMDHGWMGGSWMDRSIDRWIDRSLMDGWIHPLMQPFVHTSARTGRRGFYSIKTCDREDRTVIAQPLFIFFNSLIFPPRRQPTTLVSARGPTAGHSFWNPMMLNKTKAFFVFCLFESFSCSPLASGREKRSFVSLKRATWKIELTLLFF